MRPHMVYNHIKPSFGIRLYYVHTLRIQLGLHSQSPRKMELVANIGQGVFRRLILTQDAVYVSFDSMLNVDANLDTEAFLVHWQPYVEVMGVLRLSVPTFCTYK